jgi:hypothetical protein
MTRDPHLEAAALRTVAELTSLADDLVNDGGPVATTTKDHARRLRAIAEALARSLPGADAQPARAPSPVRRARPPADHDRP